MSEWATFHGSAADHGDHYRLAAAGENGIVTLPKDSVAFEHGKISVKVGSVASVLEESKGIDEIASFSRDDCERTCSIGLVEFCCENGRVLGPCRARSAS